MTNAPDMTWQPIETAPKDGSAILVMQNNWPGCKNGVAESCNGHNTYVSEWWPGENNEKGDWMLYIDSVEEPRLPIIPTHWMPLPQPPET